jgi:hypothetical protein
MNFRLDDSMIDPRLLALAAQRASYVEQAASSLGRQMDDEIHAMLDRLAPGWTADDVRERLRWQTYVQRPGVETLLLDGEPILELQPPTSNSVYDKSKDTYTVTISRDVKRLT